MINLNITEIFILIKLIQMFKLTTKKKINEYEFFMINKSQLKTRIIKEIIFLLIVIQQYYKQLIFNIVFIISYNIILNMFLLQFYIELIKLSVN